MQWVTVASVCRMQFGAWPLVLKARLGSRCGRRWICRGRTHGYWQGSPFPELAASLSPCLCLLLPVSHPWQHSDGEQLMEGNTFHSNQACPSSPFCQPDAICTHLSEENCRSFGKQMPSIRCRLLCSENLRSVFQPQNDGVKWLAPCKCCKTADFLDTRRGRYDSLHKH